MQYEINPEKNHTGSKRCCLNGRRTVLKGLKGLGVIKGWHPEQIQWTEDMVWCGDVTAKAPDAWVAS